MAPAPTRLVIHPSLPSILGPDAREVSIAPISLAQHADIKNVHVFPAYLDLDRLRDALVEMTRLYPVLCARVRRRRAERTDGGRFDYYVRQTRPGSEGPIKQRATMLKILWAVCSTS